MVIRNTTPGEDGFRMPGEFEPHEGCMMIWPQRPGSWPNGAVEAQQTFTEIARGIALSEHVWMLCMPEQREQVERVFAKEQNVTGLPIATDDAWARDVGPTVVTAEHLRRGIDWQFNAWGGLFDGLYAHWEQDNMAASAF